jgi:hypothetical protein
VRAPVRVPAEPSFDIELRTKCKGSATRLSIRLKGDRVSLVTDTLSVLPPFGSEPSGSKTKGGIRMNPSPWSVTDRVVPNEQGMLTSRQRQVRGFG